ncbi:MAG: metal-dependent phosphohydrolase, partial [Alteromonas sp.]|nr:metal-dependent phosphohydrolase [Alteromonas sp.]
MLKAVPIDELKPGMYVNQVLEQSGALKMRSKGIVKTQKVIDTLRTRGIQRVEIDTEKSKGLVEDIAPAPERVAPDTTTQPQEKPINRESLNEANDLYFDAVNIQNGFLKSLKRGAAKDLKPVEELSQSLIESVFDNKDALSCLTLIKDADSYLLEHSINCSIIMGMFTQFLGYDRDTIDQASLGALLMDVGMSSL